MASCTSAPYQVASSPPTERAWMLAGFWCIIVSSGLTNIQQGSNPSDGIAQHEGWTFKKGLTILCLSSAILLLHYKQVICINRQTNKHHEAKQKKNSSSQKYVSGREWSVGMLRCIMCKIFLFFFVRFQYQQCWFNMAFFSPLSPLSRRCHKITMEEFLTNQHKLR